MTTHIKYLIPIALIKILFVFLILQLFCSSCEEDGLSYSGDIYSEAPLVEILTQLGDFSYNTPDNIAFTGDTIYLEINIESDVFTDKISGNDFVIDNGEYHTQFSIISNDGDYVFPSIIIESGEYDHPEGSDYYNASFGNTDNSVTPSNMDIPRLKLGLIFDTPGAYTFHYNNPPNLKGTEESVNVYYGQYNEETAKTSTAYAIYLFKLGENTINYGTNNDDEAYKKTILNYAVCDQAILDFTIAKKN